MEFEIPLPQKVSTNAIYAGMHWAKRKKIADIYHRAILQLKGWKIHTPAHLHFTFIFKGRMLDCTNCVFMAKCLEDGMVAHGILPDDTPEYVRAITITSQKGKRDAVVINTIP